MSGLSKGDSLHPLPCPHSPLAGAGVLDTVLCLSQDFDYLFGFPGETRGFDSGGVGAMCSPPKGKGGLQGESGTLEWGVGVGERFPS